MIEQQSYVRWLRRHPGFDIADYSEWVRARGYYKSALDVTKPEFYEYATIYVQSQLLAA